MQQKIGFIGLGIMGQLMAANIMKKGYEVMVFNRSTDKAASLAQAGAQVASTPKEVGTWADTVILMLTGPEAISAVLDGDEGLLASLAAGKTVINMSTVSPAYTRELHTLLQAKGIILLDAPVSGSKKPAEDGTLVILAGGPQDKVQEQEALLLSMGKKVVYCGEAGLGSTMKMVVNLLLGIMMEGLGEAINLGQKCGLETEVMLDTLLSGPLGCGLFGLKTEMLKTDTFPPQFPLKHMAKDINFVLETARSSKAATPVGDVVANLFNSGTNKGLAEEDFAAVKKVIAELAPL